jgi:hypothetical protein
VFPILALKGDHVTALDAHHRPIIESHGLVDAGVKDREGGACTCHMIGAARVNHPGSGVDSISFFSDLSKDTLLHKVDKVMWRAHGRRRWSGCGVPMAIAVGVDVALVTPFEITERGTNSNGLD